MNTELVTFFFNSIPWLMLPWLLFGLRRILTTMIEDDRRSREQVGAHSYNTTPRSVRIAHFVVSGLWLLSSVFAALLLCCALFIAARGAR